MFLSFALFTSVEVAKETKNVTWLWKPCFTRCIDELEILTDGVLKMLIERAKKSYLRITPFSNQAVEVIHGRIAVLRK